MKMKSITQDELDGMILKHRLWLEKKEGGEKLELCNVQLLGLTLHNVDLSCSSFFNVEMFYVTINNCNLHNSLLHNVYIDSTTLIHDTNLSASNLCNVEFNGSIIEDTNLTCSNLYETKFYNCKLTKVCLKDVILGKILFNHNSIDTTLAEAARFEKILLINNTLVDKVIQMGPIGSRKDYTLYFADKDNVRCGCWKDYKGGTLEEFKQEVEKVYPNGEYHDEYMIAIETFKKQRELYLKSNGKENIMEDMDSIDNMKLYTADAIRKMMPYSSYTAEDFVHKIIMPKIVSTALQDKYSYDFDLKDLPLKNSKHLLKDIIWVLTKLGFNVSHHEYNGLYMPFPINELNISWDKKESDKNEM